MDSSGLLVAATAPACRWRRRPDRCRAPPPVFSPAAAPPWIGATCARRSSGIGAVRLVVGIDLVAEGRPLGVEDGDRASLGCPGDVAQHRHEAVDRAGGARRRGRAGRPWRGRRGRDNSSRRSAASSGGRRRRGHRSWRNCRRSPGVTRGSRTAPPTNPRLPAPPLLAALFSDGRSPKSLADAQALVDRLGPACHRCAVIARASRTPTTLTPSGEGADAVERPDATESACIPIEAPGRAASWEV